VAGGSDSLVLDRIFFDIPAEQIADIKVPQTVVGGHVVFQSDMFAQP
jgi:predicted amidohydrolase YtcJ